MTKQGIPSGRARLTSIPKLMCHPNTSFLGGRRFAKGLRCVKGRKVCLRGVNKCKPKDPFCKDFNRCVIPR